MVFRSKLPLLFLFLYLFAAIVALAQQDPQQQYQQCQRSCQEQQQQQQCLQQCEKERQEQERQQGGPQQQQQQQSNNPYFLSQEMFRDRFRTQHGYVIQSPRFTQISNILRGIENYRIAFLEANPSTFMIPHHLDAEALFFVVRGRGTVNIVQQQNKESYNLEYGDVIRVPAGSIYYLINRDNNDKFQLAGFFQPVSLTIDTFRDFFAVGGQNPESFLRVFSDELLEAAYDVERQRLGELLGKQRQGVIVKVSQKQIQALTRHASSSREGSLPWSVPGVTQSTGPYNIFNQNPAASNEYGDLYRVDASRSAQLRDLNVEVAHYKIKKGAMVAPFYNSEATSLVLVIGGEGRFEMACPHLSSSQGQGQGGESQQQEGVGAHYQRIGAQLSPRTAFIIPAGHPVIIVASDNQNLEIVAYKINAKNNERTYLAGKNNVLKQLEREAKEISFNMPATQVDAILNNQRKSVFLPGPRQRQQGQGRHGGFLGKFEDVLAF